MSEENDQIIGLDASGLFTTVPKVIAAYAQMDSAVQKLGKNFQATSATTDKQIKDFTTLDDKLGSLTQTFSITNKTIRTTAESFKFLDSVVGISGHSIDDFKARTVKATAAIREQLRAVEDLAKAEYLGNRANPRDAAGGVIPGSKGYTIPGVTDVTAAPIAARLEWQELYQSMDRAEQEATEALKAEIRLSQQRIDQQYSYLELLKEEATQRAIAQQKAQVSMGQEMAFANEQAALIRQQVVEENRLADLQEHHEGLEQQVQLGLTLEAQEARQVRLAEQEVLRRKAVLAAQEQKMALLYAEAKKQDEIDADLRFQYEETVRQVDAERAATKEAERRLGVLKQQETTLANMQRREVESQIGKQDYSASPKDFFAKSGEEGERSANRILFSWSNMSRLLAVQLVHSGIREFMNLLTESAQETEKFEERISEIRTISQGNAQSFNMWADSVRRLSDEFGNPILDVTEGMYQTLSSQLASGAEASDLLTQALVLSKVTMSSTADAANLLYGALNSYSLSNKEAERTAAELTKTVTLGKLRAADLTETFGRVGPFAHQLGVSMEEVDAGLAMFTRSGVPATEAGTLMENVMTRLVKPSKAMTELFHELGVTSGSAAVQVYGFYGFMEKLKEATHGSSEELAALFPRLEALRGSIGFTGGLEEYKKNLDEITNKSLPEFQKAKEIALESPGEQLSIEINKIHNYLVAIFGQPIIADIVNISKSISNEGLSGAFKSLVPIVETALVGLIAYKSSLLLSTGAGWLKTRWVESDTIAEKINIQTTEMKTAAYKLETLALEEETRAMAAAAAGDELESVSAGQAAAANRAKAATLLEVAEAEGVATGAGIRMASMMSGLGATLSNPVFLATAAITAIYYLYKQTEELETEQRESYEKARLAAVKEMSEMTKGIEEELAKQEKAWDEALGHQFTAYTEFGGKISQQLAELETKQVEATRETVDVLKEALGAYLKDVEKVNRQVEKSAEDHAANAKAAALDLDADREKYAERDYDRQMRAAALADRLASDTKGHPVDAAQIALEQTELARRHLQSTQLSGQSSDDPTIAKGHLQALQKSLEAEYSLVSNFQKRTERLTEEEAKVQHELDEATKASGISVAAAQLSAHARAERAEIRHRETQNSRIREEIKGTQEQEAHMREQYALDQKAEKVAELGTRLKSIQDSKALMPKLNEYQKIFNDLQEQGVKGLKEFGAIEVAQAEKKKEEAANEQGRFDQLKATLQEIQKLKYEKTLGTPEGLNATIEKLDRLTKQAQGLGLNDQGILGDINKERAAFEDESHVQQAQAELKKTQARIAEQQTKIKTERARLSANVDTPAKQTEDALSAIKAIIGLSPTNQGSLGNIIDQRTSADVTGHLLSSQGTLDSLKGKSARVEGLDIEALRQKERALIAVDLEARKTGQVINLGLVHEFQKVIADFTEKVKQQQVRGKFGSGPLTDLDVNPGAVDESGRPVPILNVAETLANLQKEAIEVEKKQIERNKAVQESWDQNKILSEKLNNDIQLLSQFETAQIKEDTSFSRLAEVTNGLVESLGKLKAALDALPHAPGHADGGMIFSSKGTDTVPAMLTPGEFVVDEKTTRKYLPLLKKLKYYGIGGLVDSNLFQDDYHKRLADLYERNGLHYDSFLANRPKSTISHSDRMSSAEQLAHMYSTYGIQHQGQSKPTVIPHHLAVSSEQQMQHMYSRYGLHFNPNAGRFHTPQMQINGEHREPMHFGPFTINLTSSGDTKIDAKRLVTEIQRELRRTGAKLLGATND